jgi:ubiquinone/menaquinone biosynthesis C-methylase UbiE
MPVMKTYQEVVQDRYDGWERGRHIYDNEYSLINPVGFYGGEQIRKAFFKIFNKIRQMDIDVTTLKFLDVGCGTGALTRLLGELVGSAKNVYGVDLSSNRIEMARDLNPRITYTVEDILELSFKENFDVVTAKVVFSHLNTEKQIMIALEKIASSLKEDGFFIWYDMIAKDHFQSLAEDESIGFSRKQMEEYCRKFELMKLFEVPVFKNIIRRFHTLNLCKKFPTWMVWLIENVIPAPPGNIIMVFRKQSG